MGPGEIILIIVCAAIVIGVITASIVKKKQGKHTCDCGFDCAHCPGCSSCSSKPKTNKK